MFIPTKWYTVLYALLFGAMGLNESSATARVVTANSADSATLLEMAQAKQQSFSTSSAIPGMFTVLFTGVTPQFDEKGYASACVLNAKVMNGTNYHMDRVIVRVGSFQFETDDLPANTQKEGLENPSIVLQESDGTTCADQARYLVKNVDKAYPLDCSMQGVATEGDCQHLVHVSANIRTADIQALDDLERGKLQEIGRVEQVRQEEKAAQKKQIESEIQAYCARVHDRFDRREEKQREYSSSPECKSHCNSSTIPMPRNPNDGWAVGRYDAAWASCRNQWCSPPSSDNSQMEPLPSYPEVQNFHCDGSGRATISWGYNQ